MQYVTQQHAQHVLPSISSIQQQQPVHHVIKIVKYVQMQQIAFNAEVDIILKITHVFNKVPVF